MRTATQPGPVQEPRVLGVSGTGRPVRLQLGRGEDLLDGAAAALTGASHRDAALRLIGGTLSGLHYMTGQPDDSGHRVATYGAPTVLDGPVTLVDGNLILGRKEDGSPIVHCHAVIVDNTGRLHGGHVVPGKAPVVTATLVGSALDGTGFALAPDPETNYTIFHPHRGSEVRL